MSREQPSKLSQFRPHALIVFLLAMIVLIAGLLWHVTFLRSYLIGAGAALAAFLAPLPGLFSPTTRGKWSIAVVMAALIGIGVLFGTDNLAREKDSAEMRLESQRDSVEAAIKDLPVESQGKFVLNMATRMRQQYHAHQFLPVLDNAHLLGALDRDNGHSLYFAGEAYRSLAERTDMRGALQHYLAAADAQKGALDGNAAQCYARPSGYCAERTAWIEHLLASDYYQEARHLERRNKADALQTAYRFEHHVLEIRPLGFYRLATIESSCELLQDIRTQMTDSGKSTAQVDSDAQSLRCEWLGVRKPS